MHPYFKNMPAFGKALSDKKKEKALPNRQATGRKGRFCSMARTCSIRSKTST